MERRMQTGRVPMLMLISSKSRRKEGLKPENTRVIKYTSARHDVPHGSNNGDGVNVDNRSYLTE